MPNRYTVAWDRGQGNSKGIWSGDVVQFDSVSLDGMMTFDGEDGTPLLVIPKSRLISIIRDEQPSQVGLSVGVVDATQPPMRP